MHIRVVVAVLLIALGGAAAAQQPTTLVPVVTADIVVQGRHHNDEPDFTNSQPMVIVGSRIPRMSSQHTPWIASATSLGGLTTDSGMDAFQNSSVKRWKTCKVTGAALSKQTACSLVAVEKAMAKQDFATAQQLVHGLLARPAPTIEDSYVLATYLYRIAEAIPDPADKRRALAAMVDTGFMAADDEIAALGTLARMAYQSGQQDEALARYRQIAALLPDDTDSRVNAAVMLQNLGQGDAAKAELRNAVAIAERNGRDVPKAWLDNLR